MTNEIINRVANSSLITIDLEDFYPEGNRVVLDMKQWLFKELILKEADFRLSLKNHDWSNYKNAHVAITCSSDAIIPSWAYLLLSTYLNTVCKTVVIGNLKELETRIFYTVIENLDISIYKNKPVIIKGCTHKPIPETAYILLLEKLQPVAKSIMFGEACSSVPLYKNKS